MGTIGTFDYVNWFCYTNSWKGLVLMKTKYDNSTKDKREVSYIDFVDTILTMLGFRINMSGTRLLRDFVIYLYIKQPLEIDIKKEVIEYLKIKNVKMTYNNFNMKIYNAINYADINKMKNNFYSIFKTEFDYYYLSVKTIIIFMTNVMEKNKF